MREKRTLPWGLFGTLLAWGFLHTGGAGIAASSTERPLVCALCRLPIEKVYFKLPGSAEHYCGACYEKNPHCVFCGRPYLPASPQKAEVKKSCPRCHAEAVTDPGQAAAILQKVRTWVRDDMQLDISCPIHFRLEESLAPFVETPLLGEMRELGAFVREGGQITIVILSDMPRPLLIETAAHELAHAWQAENCPAGQTLTLKEGFAQWVAARALEAFGCKEALTVLENREDFYGEGYRSLRSLEMKQGKQGVLRHARENR